MFISVTFHDSNGQELGMIVLSPKTFKSGKTGWHGQGKLEIAGKRYQCQAQMVAIGDTVEAQHGT